MTSQDGRYTVAYKSESFPFFTVNDYTSTPEDGTVGGAEAFFKRLDIINSNQTLLRALNVTVTSDCQFRCDRRDSVEFLIHWLYTTFGDELSEVGEL